MHFLDIKKHRISDYLVELDCLKGIHESLGTSLRRDGCVLIPNFLPKDICTQLIAKGCDTISNQTDHVSMESNGSDSRIYGVDRLIPDYRLETATKILDDCARKFYRTSKIEYFQMLGNITYTENNLGSGGGWHRDSPYSHQFKFILYLNDVDLENGPFEYIKGTHLSKEVINYSRRAGRPLTQYRFSDLEVEAILNGSDYEVKTLTGNAGSLLVADVKGLHRGKPLQRGARWATTRYYFRGTIPHHFQTLLPKTN